MGLSAADILRIWEVAQGQDPLTRALSILAAVFPGASREDLGRLPLGARDARLLAVREETFGPTVEGIAACPSCAEPVEFTLDISRFAPAAERPAEGHLDADGWSLTFRAPCSEDLAALPATGGEAARRALAGRCLLQVRRDGVRVEEPDLSPDVVTRIAEAMTEGDPLAEILLDYACPACGRRGQTLFDIAAFLWDEIRAEARRLLREVDALARAYGWREGDILALSAARRRAYLEIAI